VPTLIGHPIRGENFAASRELDAQWNSDAAVESYEIHTSGEPVT
jgi:hypothetical protein